VTMARRFMRVSPTPEQRTGEPDCSAVKLNRG